MAGRPQPLHGNGHDDRGGHSDPSFALGAIGMEDELVRARISHMAERLDDVASLKNDFAQLLEPIAAFAAELPQLKAKLLETESMLAREREGHGSLAQQIRGLKGENLKLQDQLGGLSAHNNELRERSKEQEAALAAIRRDLRGRISMPLIGLVHVAGQSTAQVEHAIAVKLKAGYVREPKVTVEVDVYRPFFVLGEVTTSGQFPYVNGMTVQTAVAIAGGYTPRAFKRKIEVTHQVNGLTEHRVVSPNYPVRPGDTVHIAERWF